MQIIRISVRIHKFDYKMKIDEKNEHFNNNLIKIYVSKDEGGSGEDFYDMIYHVRCISTHSHTQTHTLSCRPFADPE